jgi:ribosomal protein L37AE/L43A
MYAMEYRIDIKCPNCQQESEIRLEEGANMVILNCSKCKSSLMYYHGKTYEVDSVEMRNLVENKFQAVQGFMKIKEPRKFFSEKEPSPNNLHPVGEAVRQGDFTEDDLLDLHILLESSDDVNEFLKQLEK